MKKLSIKTGEHPYDVGFMVFEKYSAVKIEDASWKSLHEKHNLLACWNFVMDGILFDIQQDLF